eukprot:786083_1
MALRIVIDLGDDMKTRMTLKTQVVYNDLVDWCLAKKQDLSTLHAKKQRAKEMAKQKEEDTEDATEQTENEEEKDMKETVTNGGKIKKTFFCFEGVECNVLQI